MTIQTNEILMNPVRMRIVQCFLAHETATSAEISGWLSDIPRATLYRHINVLAENEILTIVNKTKIRGATERTFTLNYQKISETSGGNASQKAFSILMGLYRDFDHYFSSESPDPVRDYVFLKTDEMMLNDREYNAFLVEMLELIKAYSGRSEEGRTLRRLSMISAPSADKD